MSITFKGHEYLGYSQYLAQRPAMSMATGTEPPYAHPSDQKILSLLNKLHVNKAIEQSVDSLVTAVYGHQISSSPHASDDTYPELFSIVCDCAKTLNIPIPLVMVSEGAGLINAFTAGTDDFSFIGISPTLLKTFSLEEVRFVIGHECGHIASGHMAYHSLASLITSSVGKILGPLADIPALPLQAWVRRSEVTADRAGLLCCGDLEVAIRALKHLAVGFGNPDDVDTEDYIREADRADKEQFGSGLLERFESHPMIPRRLTMLKLFAGSELYNRLAGIPVPSGQHLLSKEELDQQVREILV